MLVAANHAQSAIPKAANVNANALAYTQLFAYNKAHAMAQDLQNPTFNGRTNHTNGNHHHYGRVEK